MSHRGYDIPCTLPRAHKRASVIIQSLSHNQLFGWEGQRCAMLTCSAGIEQCTNKSAVLERGMETSQNSSLRL